MYVPLWVHRLRLSLAVAAIASSILHNTVRQVHQGCVLVVDVLSLCELICFAALRRPVLLPQSPRDSLVHKQI